MSLTWWNCGARRRVGLDLRRPATPPSGCACRRSARRAAWCPCTACCPPRPSRRGTCCRSSASRARRGRRARSSASMCCCDRGRDAVLRQQLADRAVLAFGRGAVVAPDVEDRACCRRSRAARSRRRAGRPVRRRARRSRRTLPSAGAGTASRSPGCCPRTAMRRGPRRELRVLRESSPCSLARANTRSRYSSQPSSNLPLYLSAHSFMMWCGPCDAPGAQYMKNGLSGCEAPCCSRSQSIASSAMSSLRW